MDEKQALEAQSRKALTETWDIFRRLNAVLKLDDLEDITPNSYTLLQGATKLVEDALFEWGRA